MSVNSRENPYVLAIDPGNEKSGYALIDYSYKPIQFGVVDNKEMLEIMDDRFFINLFEDAPTRDQTDAIVFEMVSHYGSGMPAGKTVFDTCFWIGRYWQHSERYRGIIKGIMYRKEVKLNLCGSMRAKDGNIIQALVDRFAPGAPNHGKGTKKEPGWFYGFKADIWQAYALGVTYLDLKECAAQPGQK